MNFKKFFFLFFLFNISIFYSFSQAAPANQGTAPQTSQPQAEQSQTAVNEAELLIPDEVVPTEVPQEDASAPPKLGTFTFWDFLRMILVLLFVVACIYGLFYLLKKAGRQKFDENDLINVIASKALAPSKSIHIVEVTDKILVLGIADNAVSMLAEITDKESMDKIRLRKGEIKAPAENNFYRYMVNIMMKKFKKNAGNAFNSGGSASHTPADFAGSADFLKEQRERLEDM